jgi:hypothetical protein
VPESDHKAFESATADQLPGRKRRTAAGVLADPSWPLLPPTSTLGLTSPPYFCVRRHHEVFERPNLVLNSRDSVLIVDP